MLPCQHLDQWGQKMNNEAMNGIIQTSSLIYLCWGNKGQTFCTFCTDIKCSPLIGQIIAGPLLLPECNYQSWMLLPVLYICRAALPSSVQSVWPLPNCDAYMHREILSFMISYLTTSLGDSFCVSRKGRTGRGGWVYLTAVPSLWS